MKMLRTRYSAIAKTTFCLLLAFCGLKLFLLSAKANDSGRGALSKQDASLSSPPNSKEKRAFRLSLVSDGTLCPITNQKCADRGIWWKMFTLLASDGHTLYLTSIPFPSEERSNKRFQGWIEGAEKILRREPEFDSKGEQIGERALASYSAVKNMKAPSGVPHYRLFWTSGKNYVELEGERLEDVLAVENKLKSEGFKSIWTW
jgi:hypothetical protein